MMNRPLFLDLDGVITNWDKAAHELHNLKYYGSHDKWPYAKGPAGWNFIKELGFSYADWFAPMGHEFWANLEFMPDGLRILQICKDMAGPLNVFLLTSPCATLGTIEGRMEWIRRELPEFSGRTIVAPVDEEGHGSKHAIARSGAILVDDYDRNVTEWEKHGGTGLLFPRPWNSNHTVTDPYAWLLMNLSKSYGESSCV